MGIVPKIIITQKQLQILKGLDCGRCYISATEQGSGDYEVLVTNNLVRVWSCTGVINAWEITREGKEVLRDYGK